MLKIVSRGNVEQTQEGGEAEKAMPLKGTYTVVQKKELPHATCFNDISNQMLRISVMARSQGGVCGRS